MNHYLTSIEEVCFLAYFDPSDSYRLKPNGELILMQFPYKVEGLYIDFDSP